MDKEAVFYCRDCGKEVEEKRIHPVKYLYACPICDGRNVSIGNLESLQEHYAKKHR